MEVNRKQVTQSQAATAGDSLGTTPSHGTDGLLLFLFFVCTFSRPRTDSRCVERLLGSPTTTAVTCLVFQNDRSCGDPILRPFSLFFLFDFACARA